MASSLEVFEASVAEAAHALLAVPDGDAAIANLVAGFAEIVDGLGYPEIAQFLLPALPRLVRDEAGEGSIVNPIWIGAGTFSPVFYALARDYYERVRPVAYPAAPHAIFSEDAAALFGCRLETMKFDEEGRNPVPNGAILLWAGCAAASVKLHFQQPVALAISYPLLFGFVRS